MSTSAEVRKEAAPFVLAVIGVFVLLNRWFGTGSMEGLLEVSWDQASHWIELAVGLVASVLLVELVRRHTRRRDRWFVDLYAGIGLVIVLEAFFLDFLGAAFSPLEPVFALLHGHGVWSLVGVVALLFAMIALPVAAMRKRVELGGLNEGMPTER